MGNFRNTATHKAFTTRGNGVCQICGYVYDPGLGGPYSGIKPGTPFKNLSDAWCCPINGAPKSDFYVE